MSWNLAYFLLVIKVHLLTINGYFRFLKCMNERVGMQHLNFIHDLTQIFLYS